MCWGVVAAEEVCCLGQFFKEGVSGAPLSPPPHLPCWTTNSSPSPAPPVTAFLINLPV
jgi:hypothetical protein